MNYALNKPTTGKDQKQQSSLAAVRSLWPLLADDTSKVFVAFGAIIVNSVLNLVGPYLIGRAIDLYVTTGNYGGIIKYSLILFAIYAVAFVANYIQVRAMGGTAQRMLFKLRSKVFAKLQELPVAFFNQNKAGDLISRINNDTDKLNQFFSQSLMQFIGSLFIMTGACIFLLVIHWKLGLVALVPAAVVLIFTRIISGWVRNRNKAALTAGGGMSAEIQESLDHFKVIVAFDRRDYFRQRFHTSNEANFGSSIKAGVANNIFIPIYGLASNIAQLLVLALGIWLVAHGQFTVGLLISFFTYVYRFYDPMRQLASLWTSFQTALAGWDRINAILSMESDMQRLPAADKDASAGLLEFRKVHFRYPDGKEVLSDINFHLEPGKTYALVGPTGGGKTTTASLMARLYDPTEGSVLLDGKDIRSYDDAERARKIGFILQEPFLFTGTVRDNILYGNEKYETYSDEQIKKVLEDSGLGNLLTKFDKGLETPVTSGGDAMSLGQRQLIAFIRAVLREPALLILDEATANVDTVTEQLLEDILSKLPKSTTKVIIAHRLNTIENADEIFFVNSGRIERAGSLDHAVEMLLHGKRES